MQTELKDLSQLRQLAAPMAGEMVVNMGPQHPSTHGVLRLVLEMDGEVIQKRFLGDRRLRDPESAKRAADGSVGVDGAGRRADGGHRRGAGGISL